MIAGRRLHSRDFCRKASLPLQNSDSSPQTLDLKWANGVFLCSTRSTLWHPPCPCKNGLVVLTSNLALHGHVRCEGVRRQKPRPRRVPANFPSRQLSVLTEPPCHAWRQPKQDMAISLKARRLCFKIFGFHESQPSEVCGSCQLLGPSLKGYSRQINA